MPCRGSSWRHRAGCRFSLCFAAVWWLAASPGVAFASEPSARLDRDIAALIETLGRDRAADTATLNRLRPLVQRYRGQAAQARSPVLHEQVWFGVIRRVQIDKRDATGNLAAGLEQVYLDTGTGHLKLYGLTAELEAVETGARVIVTGYLSGNRVLVLSVQPGPQVELPR